MNAYEELVAEVQAQRDQYKTEKEEWIRRADQLERQIQELERERSELKQKIKSLKAGADGDEVSWREKEDAEKIYRIFDNLLSPGTMQGLREMMEGKANVDPCRTCHEYNVYQANYCPDCGRSLRSER